MAAWQDGTVESNGLHFHYTRTGGDKSPIVLAHGLTDNGQAWTRLVGVLEPTYDLIMVDARGHGLSDKPESGYTPTDHMRDLAGVIQALGLQKPIVMGHSMGAVTVSMVSGEYPDLVSATILEDPVWRWPRPSAQTAADRRRLYDDWYKRVAYRKTLTAAESYARGRRERPLWTVVDHDSDIVAKEQLSMQVLDYVLAEQETWAQQVSRFKSPVLLIYGDPALGSIVGPDVAGEARRINELVEPRQIPGAGHSIRRERFDDYVAVLREFLARLRRG